MVQADREHNKDQTPEPAEVEKALPEARKVAGPGTTKIQELMGKGEEGADKYARILREFPEEKAAILLAIQQAPALGNKFAQEVMESAKGLDLSVDDKRLSYVSEDSDAYFVAGQKEKGARFKTGDLTGTIDKEGLTTDYALEDGNKIHSNTNVKDKKLVHSSDYVTEEGKVGVGGYVDTKDSSKYGVDVHGEKKVGEGTGSAKVGMESSGGVMAGVGELGYKDKTDTGNLKARYADDDNYSLAASGSHKLEDGKKVSGGLSYGEKAGEGTIAGNVGVSKDKVGSVGLSGSYTNDDNYSLGLSGSRDLGEGRSLSASLGHSEKEGVSTESLNLGYKYGGGDLGLSGSYTSDEDYKLGLTGNQKLSDQLSLSESLSHEMAGGEATTRGGLDLNYKSDDLIMKGHMGAELGPDGTKYDANASGTMGLGDSGNLYGHAFAGASGGSALDAPVYHVGGGLTLTMKEKHALSLVGAVDNAGGFDTRLQYDLFKSKVNSASDLSAGRKKSVLSAFVGIRGGGMDMDNIGDHYGSGRMGHESGQAYVGIGFNF